MGVYERILVPLEGTETDEPVLEHVAELAALCGAEVTLLRVAHFHTRDERACEMDDAEARHGARRGASCAARGFDVQHADRPRRAGRGHRAAGSRARAPTSSPWPRTGTAGRSGSCWAASPSTCGTTATCRCCCSRAGRRRADAGGDRRRRRSTGPARRTRPAEDCTVDCRDGAGQWKASRWRGPAMAETERLMVVAVVEAHGHRRRPSFVVLFIGGSALAARFTESNKFCGTDCHEMWPYRDTWAAVHAQERGLRAVPHPARARSTS